MSPLTKIFVVLLVVTSMLFTAASVVFVVKLKPLDQSLRDMTISRDTAVAAAHAAQNDASKAQSETKQVISDRQNDKAAAAKEHAQMQADIDNLKTMIATITAEKANLASQNAAISQQISLLITKGKTDDATLAALREANGKLVVQQEDQSRRNAELASQVEVLTDQSHNATEQLARAQDENQKFRAFIKSIGRNPEDPLGGGFVPSGAGQPPISGLVTEKKEFNGMTMVTINVGTVDGVQVGTEFSILNPKGDFLGFVKVDHVDNNLCIGKFNGKADKQSELQPSDSAKTQIRGS